MPGILLPGSMYRVRVLPHLAWPSDASDKFICAGTKMKQLKVDALRLDDNENQC